MKFKSKDNRVIVAVLIIVIVGALGFVGYGAFSNRTDTAHTNTPTDSDELQPTQKIVEQKKESVGTIITTGNSEFGTMLFNDKGQAIYIWELEKSKEAECYGSCAKAWPPVLTSGAPQATGEVKNELLGTIKRTDGTMQVTYNGHPLYYYAHEKPGEVKCHNISTHGGLWWVIQPNGIRAD